MEKANGASEGPPPPQAEAPGTASGAAPGAAPSTAPSTAPSAAPSAAPGAAPSRHLHELPDDVLRAVFALLLERDLCRVAQVCARFRALADDPLLWRKLYKDVFTYDFPLVHPEPRVFEFVDPDDSEYANPWKECFQQFYHALHVRPGYQDTVFCGRNIKYFDTVSNALTFARNSVAASEMPGHDVVIFVHAGNHRAEILVDFNVSILGAASGIIRKSVILMGTSASTVKFANKAEVAYLGYLTIRFSPDPGTSYAHYERCCVEIGENCSPTVDNCIVRSSSLYGSAIRVSGESANPLVKYCRFSNCRNRGLCIEDYAEGSYEHNHFVRSRLTGIWVRNMANPIIRGNVVHSGHEVGVRVSGKGSGVFEANDVYNNRVASFEVTEGATPSVLRCELGSGVLACVYIHHGGLGVFLENKLCSSISPGVCILSSDPTIRHNTIYNCKVGVHIAEDARGLVEENDIFGCSIAGISVIRSHPIILQNKIHHGKLVGIHVSDKGRGYIVGNEIYSNALNGMRIETSSTSIVRSNRIYSGKIGVHFRNGGNGELEENVIFNNEYSNVKIESGSNPVVRRNKIRSGENAGILINNRGLGLLEENEIFDNAIAGVWIKNFSNPTLLRNKIFDGKGCGVSVLNNGRGLLKENQIFRNSQSGVLICSGSDPILRQNRVFYGLGAGIEITQSASATLECNQVFYNKFSGICLASGVEPILKKNKIYDNEEAVEKAVTNGQCLYAISSNTSAPMHDFYSCESCESAASNRICVNCVAICHAGHAASFVRRDKFSCACGAGALGSQCQLQGETPRGPDPPPDPAPPAESSAGERE